VDVIDQRSWLLVVTCLALVAAFFAVRERWAHVLGVAPYLVLLACPLLHLFYGRGHDDSNSDGGR
jgi:hypothetical protein